MVVCCVEVILRHYRINTIAVHISNNMIFNNILYDDIKEEEITAYDVRFLNSKQR